MGQNVVKFPSVAAFRGHVRAHPEALGISPAGAAARLGVGRQRIYDLVEQGVLRCWQVYDCEAGLCEGRGSRACFVYICEADVEAYRAVPRSRGGRPRGWRVALAA